MSQVESSSSPAVKSAGTPFVWAKLVAGQKQNLLEVEAEEKAKAAEEKAKAEMAAHNRRENVIQDFEVRRISQLKADLARIGKLAEFEKKNAEEIERQKVINARYTRENGWWSLNTVRYPDDYYHQQRPIPKTVNEKALRFVQQWLTVFGDQLAPLTTLGQLEEAFQNAIVPNLLMEHRRFSDHFLTWEKNTFGSNALPNKARYTHLQQWVATQEKEYQADPHRYGSPPWAAWSLWVFAKNITWQNCLFAMSKVSGTFPGNGLLQITGHFSKPTSAIKWLVPLEPYIGTYFIQKSISVAKRKRIDEEDDMDCLMGECN